LVLGSIKFLIKKLMPKIKQIRKMSPIIPYCSFLEKLKKELNIDFIKYNDKYVVRKKAVAVPQGDDSKFLI
jgi:hypothetical protein